MNAPETPGPPPEQKPPGRFKQSRDNNSEAVDQWLQGSGRIVFGAIAVLMVLGCLYFAFIQR